MRISNSLINIVAIAVLSAALFACSNGNSGDVAPVDNNGNHPADWVHKHPAYAAQTQLAACTGCHGDNLDGGKANVSCFGAGYQRSGFQCHTNNPKNYAVDDCGSCHNGPPNGPNGALFPNNQGAHDSHTNVPSVTCSACHNGLGSGTAHHGDGTQVVSLAPGFQAETVTTDFNYHPVNPNDQTKGGTCSGVSCHGGQVSPEWLTGKWSNGNDFNLATDCLKCHEEATAAPGPGKPTKPQYNSYYSGVDATYTGVPASNTLHHFHVSGLGKDCTECHNINRLSDSQTHFSGVTTNTFTDPGATVGSAPTKIGTYDKATKTCFNTNLNNSNPGCHIANFVGHWQ
ncbi:MAG TPA: CxxxxCH/CxxCH domain-containing protein [Desulfuromonadaceae bacterium]